MLADKPWSYAPSVIGVPKKKKKTVIGSSYMEGLREMAAGGGWESSGEEGSGRVTPLSCPGFFRPRGMTWGKGCVNRVAVAFDVLDVPRAAYISI